MEWWLILSVALFLLFGLFASGIPIFVAFLVLNVSGVAWLMGERGFGIFANSLYDTLTSEILTTIALFVLLGELLFRSGSVGIIFDALDALLGRIKGRLYVFVVALSMLFGTLSGSALAVAAMLSRSALPTMQDRGYDTNLSVGLILGGATLAAIIPPSVLVIIIGSMVDVSIARLLIAGILPGTLVAGLFLIYVYLRILINPSIAPKPATEAPSSWKAKVYALASLLPFSTIIGAVLGFILLGIATPSESAATGVAGALLVAAFYRRLSWELLTRAFLSSLAITSMLLIILASSKLFSQLLSFTGATAGLVAAATGLDVGPTGMFIILMLLTFFACMFIDQIALMLVLIPIYAPLVVVFEYNPIWFWTMFLINVSVGSLTPPFGYNLFAVKGGAPHVPVQTIYNAAWPIVGCFMLGVLLLFFFPEIVTWLPSLL